MKIAIDVSQVVYGTGVSTYTRLLVANLLKYDTKNEYLLYAGTLRRSKDIKSVFPSAKILPIPPSLANLFWNKLHILPIEKLIGQIDLVHTSDWAEPPAQANKVTTVHDLAPFLYPNLFPRDLLRDIVSVHKAKLAWVREESKRIIVPTEATKTDLVNLGYDSQKIRVINEAPDPIFSPQSDQTIKLVTQKLGIHGRYILCVGIDPRKNTERIIKAFEQATAGHDVKLVLVGTPKYVNFKAARNVRALGQVNNLELSALYSGAITLAYPSMYEGFGLPILEAMACGCPVITSNLSSMSEISGGAALLVDPTSTESIKSAMEKMVRGGKIYKDKGLKHVKNFSWQKAALETIKVYQECQP